MTVERGIKSERDNGGRYSIGQHKRVETVNGRMIKGGRIVGEIVEEGIIQTGGDSKVR